MEAIAISKGRKDLEAELRDYPPVERVAGFAVCGLGVVLAVGGLAFLVRGSLGSVGATGTPGALLSAVVAVAGASLALAGWTLARVAGDLRRRALEFEGLVEEISQEFDKVNHQHDLLADAVTSTDRTVSRLRDRVRRQERDAGKAVTLHLEK